MIRQQASVIGAPGNQSPLWWASILPGTVPIIFVAFGRYRVSLEERKVSIPMIERREKPASLSVKGSAMNRGCCIIVTIFIVTLAVLYAGCTAPSPPGTTGQGTIPSSLVERPYDLDTGLTTRSISFENPTGAPGEGGKAANYLGVGRKGAPSRNIVPDTTVVLCDIAGPGTIRHIWFTGPGRPEDMRSIVIRAYWDGQEYPSIECPMGDFMGYAHGRFMSYQSAVHSVGQNNAMNIWLPMPFTSRARLTFTNEGENTVTLYYQIDYTIGDIHPAQVGRLHVLFRRENPTEKTRDFALLPKRTGTGRFIGAVVGIHSIESKNWWGEGEIKVYLDGDTEFPTICGTGSEDWICLSYGMQQTPFLYHGCSLNDTENGYVSMYRWHLPDPIYWRQECRITIQQIGYRRREQREKENESLYERSDDWSTATFWYEQVPSEKLPEMPGRAERIADIAVDK